MLSWFGASCGCWRRPRIHNSILWERGTARLFVLRAARGRRDLDWWSVILHQLLQPGSPDMSVAPDMSVHSPDRPEELAFPARTSWVQAEVLDGDRGEVDYCAGPAWRSARCEDGPRGRAWWSPSARRSW